MERITPTIKEQKRVEVMITEESSSTAVPNRRVTIAISRTTPFFTINLEKRSLGALSMPI
jgi:hypothetical protein